MKQATSLSDCCRYERSLSRFAHSNICVSEAMKKDLQMRLGIRFDSCTRVKTKMLKDVEDGSAKKHRNKVQQAGDDSMQQS